MAVNVPSGRAATLEKRHGFRWFQADRRSRDILISAILNPNSPRMAIVPSGAGRFQIHSSVYIIRVSDDTVLPEDVFAFVRSDAGMRSIQRVASFMGGHLRITARNLEQLQIFLPEKSVTPAPDPSAQSLQDSAPAEQSLSAAAQAIHELQTLILPDLQVLEREPQTRDATVISARLRALAGSLAPPPLADRVMLRYPMPVALAYRRFIDSRFNVYEQVLRLRDLFEAASFLVYNIVLADALRRLPSDGYALQDRNARVAYDGFSMAHRISFVEGIANIAKERRTNELFIPELCTSSFCADAKRLQSDFRNHISHSATASESRQRSILNRYQPVVESLLDGLAFLEDYRLARIASLHMREGRYVRRVELYQGVTPAIDEQVFDTTQQPELAEHDHLVLLDENDDHLDLFPMYQFVASEQTGDDTHMCCFKQRRGKELQGESVQAPIEVTLEGSLLFETLRRRFHDAS